jgi:pimeloyl-ACP methyl ester carboxylesterase
MMIFNPQPMRFAWMIIACLAVLLGLPACQESPESKGLQKVTLEKPAERKKDTFIWVIDTTDVKYKKFPYLLAYDKALALWQIPFEEKDLKTTYGNAHVIISGPQNGEPLVLLHGMNATSTMWYPNIKALSERYRVYAIDFLLEPGKSTCDKEISETPQIMKWYDEVFKQLELEDFYLLGASRGGWLATNIALNHKTQVKKLILLSPAQTFIWIRPGSKALSNLFYHLSPKRKKLRKMLQTVTSDVDSIDQVYIDQYYMGLKHSTVNKCFVHMKPFSDKELQTLRMPVLVLIGDKDIINNKKSLKRAKKLIPHIEVGTIKDAGHFLSMDKADVINKTMVEFLGQQEPEQIVEK